MGTSSEQRLMEDIVIECLKIYGFDVYYMPRTSVNFDTILNEDPLNSFDQAYRLEMYLSNTTGFEGEGDLLTRFGVEIRDTATFIVSKRRWEEAVARIGRVQLEKRPAEGDVLYFPLTKSFFEIKRVEHKDPFFQVGKFNVFKIDCELMQFSSERVETNVEEIDEVVQNKVHTVQSYQLLDENGDTLLLEYFTDSRILLENFNMVDIDTLAQNEYFRNNISILDFSERNPFGEIQ
jgi:hypothetical protein